MSEHVIGHENFLSQGLRKFALYGALSGLALAGCSEAGAEDPDESAISSTTTEQTLAENTTTIEEDCPVSDSGFALQVNLGENPHENGSITTGGIPRGLTGEQYRAWQLDQNAKNPAALLSYHNIGPDGADENIADVNALVEGNEIVDGACYSSYGVERFNDWAEDWTITATITDTDQITHNDANIGVIDGQPAATTGPVLGEDQSGFDVEFDTDGDGNADIKHSVLDRCDNPTPDTPDHPGFEKNPLLDVLLNPDVPEQVTGPSGGTDEAATVDEAVDSEDNNNNPTDTGYAPGQEPPEHTQIPVAPPEEDDVPDGETGPVDEPEPTPPPKPDVETPTYPTTTKPEEEDELPSGCEWVNPQDHSEGYTCAGI